MTYYSNVTYNIQINIVEENFPDVPKKCVGCPALCRMASDINFALGVSVEATSQSMGTSDPEAFAASGFVSSESATVAKHQIESYGELAKNLVSNCQTGPIEIQTRSKITLRKIGSTSCGSIHPIPDSVNGSWKNI